MVVRHKTNPHSPTCPAALTATRGTGRPGVGGFAAERVRKDFKLDLRYPVKDSEMVGDTGIEPVASSV